MTGKKRNHDVLQTSCTGIQLETVIQEEDREKKEVFFTH